MTRSEQTLKQMCLKLTQCPLNAGPINGLLSAANNVSRVCLTLLLKCSSILCTLHVGPVENVCDVCVHYFPLYQRGVGFEPIIPLGNAATRACCELSSQFAELC